NTGAAVLIDVLENDVEFDHETLNIVAFTQPANGTVTLDASGQLRFTPNAGFKGATQFTYTIRDASGIEATANVFVSPVVASADSRTIAPNDPAGHVSTGVVTDATLFKTTPGTTASRFTVQQFIRNPVNVPPPLGSTFF